MDRPSDAWRSRTGIGAAILAIRREQAQPFRMIDRLPADRSRPKQGQANSTQPEKTRRLSAALRENLKRRKAQAKGRKEGPKEGRPAAGSTGAKTARPHDSAGITDEK
jgi:hypothetical protein